jgi:hypothetical protein
VASPPDNGRHDEWTAALGSRRPPPCAMGDDKLAGTDGPAATQPAAAYVSCV